MAYALALAALADGTRRGVFELLGRGDRTVGELAEAAGVSQPAVSQHLRVLEEADLVAYRAEGTRRIYRAKPEGLAELRRYLESQWDRALRAYADADAKPRRMRKGRRS